MICQNCGEENADRFRFCTGCGATLSVLPAAEARQQIDDASRESGDAVHDEAAFLDASRTIPSGGFTGNNNPPPADASRTGSFATADIPAAYSTSVSGSQANSALPPPADLRGDRVVAPPAFASNLSYRERKKNSGKFFWIAGAGALLFLIFAAIAWRQTREAVGGEESQNAQVKTNANTAGNSAQGDNDSGSNLSPKSFNAEDELKRISAELNNADTRGKKTAVGRVLKTAESRYPEDYRFTYQRAKLEAAASKNHHEAFEMLFGAGSKAVREGKAAELLSNLQKDKNSELKRLTDHREWTVLENALRRNDAEALKIKEH